ncbi:MAG: hypothetical protein WCK65_03270 [Rhodospirillaceae bacterium]
MSALLPGGLGCEFLATGAAKGANACCAGAGGLKASTAAGLVGHIYPTSITLGGAALSVGAYKTPGVVQFCMAKGLGLGTGAGIGFIGPLVLAVAGVFGVSAIHGHFKKHHDSARTSSVAVRSAILEAEALLGAMVVNTLAPGRPERRFSLRVKVPPGAMFVVWSNRDGTEGRTAAIDISFRSVHFKDANFDANGIKQLICPRINKIFDIKKSIIVRRERGHFAVSLRVFAGGVNSWMSWIEILTRIDQE